MGNRVIRNLHYHTSFKRTFLLLGLVLLGLLSITLMPSKALAVPLISNVAPLPGSGVITGNNAVTTQPWFAVGTGGYDGQVSYAKIYVPNGAVATLTVQHGNGGSNGACLPDIGSPDVQYQVHSLDANESLSGAGYALIGTKNNSGSCGSLQFTLSGGIAATKVPGHGGFHVFYFEAAISPAAGDNEKNFRLSVNNGGYVGVSAPVASYLKPWFGIYQRDAPSYGGDNWNWSVNFGARCDETPDPTPKTVGVYDIDWQVYNQPFLFETIKQDSRTDTGTNWSPAAAGGSYPTFRTFSKSPPNVAPGDPNAFVPGDHTSNNLSYTSTDTDRYGIFFQDIDWHNTIQISIPYDQFDGTPIVKCPTPYAATCTADGKVSESLSNSAIVTWKFNNTGSATWTPTDNPLTQYRRTVNGTSFSPITVPNNVAPGGSFSIQVSETQPPAGSSPKVIQYTMWRSGVGAFGSPCTLTIYPPGQTPNGVGNIQVSCSDVKIYGVSVPSTYHPPPGVHTGGSTVIDYVPAQIVITDANDSSQTSTYTVPNNIVKNDGSTVTLPVGTFDLWGGMWMHKSYNFQLRLQGVVKADSSTYNDNGAWADLSGTPFYTSQIVSQDNVSNCMDASCIQGATTADNLEPGQSGRFQLGINIVNNTTRTNYSSTDGNGYNFTVNTSGGFANVGGVSTTPGTFGTGSTTVNVGFNARLDFTGNFTVTLNFQGGAMSLPSLFNPCPSDDITPATRPFFEIRAGDLSTGGGFTTNRNGVDSCANNGIGDSPYVSPATGYNASSGPYDYAGGVRSFAHPNNVAYGGSFVQYGAYSLGLTIGTVGGPIGFYSGDNALFANKSTPNFPNINNLGYAGYLNSSPPAHCTPVDFFNNTKTTANPPDPGASPDLTSLGNGQWQHTGDAVINGATIAAGKQITLYVDGNLIINGDIRYATAWDPNNQANIPYLVIIVRGNVTLSDNVRQLDGLYIAQPNGTNGGSFETCDSSTFCPNGLTVNGAIIAQQVDLLRAHGSIGPCDAASPTCQLITNQPAEVINFVPSMVIGLPVLLQNNGGAIIPSSVEGIFSLPPVF